MTHRKLKNVPDAELDDYVDYHWDDIEAEAAKAGVGAGTCCSTIWSAATVSTASARRCSS